MVVVVVAIVGWAGFKVVVVIGREVVVVVVPFSGSDSRGF